MSKEKKIEDLKNKEVLTSYDKKAIRRAEAKKRAKREAFVTKLVGSLLLLAICVACIVAVVINYRKANVEFIDVDGEKVSGKEFDFNYGLAKSNQMNQELFGGITYATYFSSYLGYDASKDDKKQAYNGSSDTTWYDYFASITVDFIKNNKALLKAGADKNYTYSDVDADADYSEFKKSIEDAANSNNMSLNDYYKKVFGSSATESNVKSFALTYLKAVAYQKKLLAEFTPSDSEAEDYYKNNSNNYDTVSFHSYSFVAEDKTDSDKLDEAKAKASEMLKEVTSADAFKSLCASYASEDDRSKYEKEDSDPSYTAAGTYTGLDNTQATWLFDENRKAGDKTVLENATAGTYTVILFVSRQKDEDSVNNIASSLASQTLSDTLKSYTDNMSVNNISNRVKMYSE